MSISERLRQSPVTNWLIYCLAWCLFVIVLLSFWVEPKYEKGVWEGILAFSSALSGVLGFKFGITIPGGKRGEDVEGLKVTCPQCGHKFEV